MCVCVCVCLVELCFVIAVDDDLSVFVICNKHFYCHNCWCNMWPAL